MKGKGKAFKPRKPKGWAPERIMPNGTDGVTTRQKSALIAEYRRQEDNDEAIFEVLADIHVDSDNDGAAAFLAPELQHGVDSMETCNINLWEHVFRDERWKSCEPIRKRHGFEATHPGGTVDSPQALVSEEVPAQFAHVYREWSSERVGWAVLVPNRFISSASFHTGDTPSWTQGDVLGEGVNVGTGKKMVIVDLGGYDCERHMEEADVRVAIGPHIRAVGSEQGHGYGWEKRQHCFSPRSRILSPTGAGGSRGTVTGSRRGGAASHGTEGQPGETEHIGENGDEVQWGTQPRGVPIKDYDLPEDEEGVDGTQNSTARMTFPKVSHDLPDYMQSLKKKIVVASDDSQDEGHVETEEQPAGEVDSSDREWWPEFEDMAESGGSDFDHQVDRDEEDFEEVTGLEEWCMSEEAFTPVRLSMPQLAMHYRRESWSSSRVDFIGSRDNFTGPPPGLKSKTNCPVPEPHRVFNLYWSDTTVDRIALETNRYARGCCHLRGRCRCAQRVGRAGLM